MNPILILVFQILHIFKNNMQKIIFRFVKFLNFKTVLNFRCSRIWSYMKSRRDLGWVPYTKEDHSEISWKLKRLNTLYSKKALKFSQKITALEYRCRKVVPTVKLMKVLQSFLIIVLKRRRRSCCCLVYMSSSIRGHLCAYGRDLIPEYAI